MQFKPSASKTRWLLATVALLSGTAVVTVNVSAASADVTKPLPILGAAISALGLEAPPAAPSTEPRRRSSPALPPHSRSAGVQPSATDTTRLPDARPKRTSPPIAPTPPSANDVHPLAAPEANNDAYATPGDTSLVVAAPGVLANDTGFDPPTQRISWSLPTHGGLISLGNYDGHFTYAPDPGFVGTDQFEYCLFDGNVGCVSDDATVTITVGAGGPTTAVADAYTTPAGQSLVVPKPGVLANDTGVDPATQGAKFDTVITPHGFLQFTSVDGAFTYFPDPGFVGPDSFTYCIAGNQGSGSCASQSATVAITVTPSPPVANDEFATTPADTPLHVDAPGVLQNDTAVDPAIHTIKVLTSAQHGDRDLQPTGAYDYTPDPGFTGTDSFTYCIVAQADPFTCVSNEATVTIEVTPPPAVAHDDSYSSPAGANLNVDPPGVLANDTGFDAATQNLAVITKPMHGTAVVDANDGTLHYTPDDGFVGTETFTYCMILSPDGNCVSNIATVTITVTAAPVAHDDSYSTPADTDLHVDAPGVLANDTGFDDATMHSDFWVQSQQGTVDLGPDGEFVYTPDDGFTGTDTFRYCIALVDACLSNTATVTITVTEPQPPPSTSGPSGPATPPSDAPPPSADSGPGAPASGSLARTGADLRWPLGLGNLLLGLGIAITVVGVRRRRPGPRAS